MVGTISDVIGGLGKSIVTSNLTFYVDASLSQSYSGTGSTWKDLSINVNDVTLVNSPAFSSENYGNFTFDGSTQYGSFGGSNNNFSTGSIELWVKLDTPTDGLSRQMFVRTNTSAGTFNLRKVTTNKFDVVMRVANLTQYTVTSDNDATSSWTQVLGTYDGSTLKLYINGVLQSTSVSVSGSIDTAGTVLYNIGRNTSGLAYTNGKIAIASLYNRALTDAEVLQNFNAARGRFGV